MAYLSPRSSHRHTSSLLWEDLRSFKSMKATVGLGEGVSNYRGLE